MVSHKQFSRKIAYQSIFLCLSLIRNYSMIPDMKFTQHQDKSSNPIKSYLNGVVIVGETEYRQSLIIAPDSLVTDLLPATVAELTEEHFTALIQSGADVILLGTGATLTFPDQALMAQVLAQQVGLEVMDTAAACRTYNVLLSEGRNMIAALLLD